MLTWAGSKPIFAPRLLLDGVHCGDVDVDVRLDVQHEPVQSGGVRVGCGKRPLAEVAGVREVQRRVVPGVPLGATGPFRCGSGGGARTRSIRLGFRTWT